jgi:hypothetical protein
VTLSFQSSDSKLENFVPASIQIKTSVSLKATAGLRQLPQQSQDWLIEVVRSSLCQSGLNFIPEETRVIDGKEEAFFGWMAVAIAFKMHQNLVSAPQTKFIGALDMGGASKQIAFILREDHCHEETRENCHDSCRGDWMLNTPGTLQQYLSSEALLSTDSDQNSHIVSRSIHGLGLRSAMDEIVSFHEQTPSTASVSIDPIVVEMTDGMLPVATDHIATHPCLAKGEFLPGSIHDYEYILYGQGNFTQCLDLIR